NGYTFCDKVCESCDFFIVNENHRHEQDLVKFELLEKRRLIKERATNSNDKARNILSLLEKLYDNTVRVQIPSYSADRQVIQRVQKANKPNYPKEPDCLASIDKPDFLKMSISNEPKTQDIYTKMLSKIKEETTGSPKSITSDFEH
ncbi:unnamed protein product, partial [Brachionus calyciflorus]